MDERSAGFVLYREDSRGRRYLLLRHRDGGHWAFPKGRIEPGESQREAARRELAEETGIAEVEVRDGRLGASHYTFHRDGRDVDKEVVYYLARATGADVTLSREHSDWAWLDRAAAEERLTFDEARRILERAHERLSAEDRRSEVDE